MNETRVGAAKIKLLGTFLRQKRIEAQMTQTHLAKKLGYQPQFIANWERGASAPPKKIMSKLMSVLNIPKNEFLNILVAESVRHWKSILKL